MKPLDEVDLMLVETLDEALALKRWLGERRPVLGADTETGGLRYWDDRLRTVQIGDANTGWVIPVEDWLGLAKEVFEEYEEPIVFHNASFDAHFFYRYKIRVARELWDDTMVQHHLLDPPSPHGLKQLAVALVDPHADDGQHALKYGMDQNDWTWDTVPITFAPYWVYSAFDPILTARLWEMFHEDVNTLYRDPYEIEMANVWAHVEAEARGMRIDTEYAEQLRDILHDRAADLRGQGARDYGVSLGSGAEVTAKLVEDGIELWKKTSGGNWSLDKQVLEELSGMHPLADMVVEYKRAIKFQKSYVTASLDHMGADGRVHANIRTLDARTRRMAVAAPPLQQVPSKDWKPRRMIVPGCSDRCGCGERHVLLSCDLSNIEPRLVAHYSQDKTMLAAFRNGDDVHQSMALSMYGKDAGPKERKKSKSGTLGKLYGIGIAKFALQQGVTEEEAIRFLDFYDDTFPAIQQLIDQLISVAEDRWNSSEKLAYVNGPWGTIHTLKPSEARDGQFYKLVNYLAQGTAAELLKRAIARCDAEDLLTYYIMAVHDELMFDLPLSLAVEIGIAVRDVMEHADDGKLSVPLLVDVELYPESWAQSVEDYHSETDGTCHGVAFSLSREDDEGGPTFRCTSCQAPLAL